MFKYKRSKWFQGLLQAEELYKEGYEDILVSERSAVLIDGYDIRRKYFVGIHGVSKVQGIHDYYAHVLNNLISFKKILKSLDKHFFVLI